MKKTSYKLQFYKKVLLSTCALAAMESANLHAMDLNNDRVLIPDAAILNRVLTITNANVDMDFITNQIASCNKHNTLSGLSIKHSTISNEVFSFIAKELGASSGKLKAVTSLTISNCLFDSDAIKLLTGGFEDKYHRVDGTTLGTWGSQLTVTGGYLHNSNITSLTLSENQNFGDDQLLQLIQRKRLPHNLEILEIEGCNITEKSIRHFIEGNNLRFSSSLQKLKLKRNEITNSIIDVLSDPNVLNAFSRYTGIIDIRDNDNMTDPAVIRTLNNLYRNIHTDSECVLDIKSARLRLESQLSILQRNNNSKTIELRTAQDNYQRAVTSQEEAINQHNQDLQRMQETHVQQIEELRAEQSAQLRANEGQSQEARRQAEEVHGRQITSLRRNQELIIEELRAANDSRISELQQLNDQRSRHIASLQATITQNVEEMRVTQEMHREQLINTQRRHEQDMNALRIRANALESTLSTSRAALANSENLVRDLQESLAALGNDSQLESARLESELAQARANYSALTYRNTELESQQTRLQENLLEARREHEAIAQNLTEQRELRRQTQGELERVRLTLTQSQQEQQHLQRRIGNLLAERTQMQAKIVELEAKVERLSSRIHSDELRIPNSVTPISTPPNTESSGPRETEKCEKLSYIRSIISKGKNVSYTIKNHDNKRNDEWKDPENTRYLKHIAKLKFDNLNNGGNKRLAELINKGALSSVEELNLHGEVYKELRQSFSKLNKLKKLTLHGSKMKDKQKTELRNALPSNIEIIY